ncbi:hypothetical protein OIU78_018105, partial [Salix suchowensis]
MKITGKPNSTPEPELFDLKPRRKSARNPNVIRLKRPPETPLLKWKIQEDRHNNNNSNSSRSVGGEEEEESGGGGHPRIFSQKGRVSARKLAAGLWRLQLPDPVHEERRGQLGFQPGMGQVGISVVPHHHSKVYVSEAKDPLETPSCIPGTRNRFLCKGTKCAKYMYTSTYTFRY